ncbi:MAG: S1-like domain-containing RNA-binding protein [Pseudomonadota bacterium]|nr:S1-like domain-containing RNA-binding protein [Pseudomonadota bacterium]
MPAIGRMNTLTVSRITSAGTYLDGGQLGDIFLNARQSPQDCSVGDALEVFVLHDNDGSLIASLQRPELLCNEVGLLRVSAITTVGAFLDWGLNKELLLPHSEQLGTVREGQAVLVMVYTDLRGRLVATMRLDKHIADSLHNLPDNAKHRLNSGDRVSIHVANKTELGYKCVVNHCVWGLLYDSELNKPLRRGERLSGWIQRVRPDQRLDLTLNKPARERAPDIAELILRQLDANDGFLALGDKSPPEAIKRIFGVSKKAFKQGLSRLYKERKIIISDRGITLNKGE